MGQPQKRVIVSREHGYHGMHAWGTALAGMPVNKAGYGGDIIEEVVHVGWSDTESLGALFEQRGHEIAAFIGEPVIGAGGVYPPEPSYWPEVQRLCREHDVLLIADEVITGFGRTGHLWGSQRYGIEPDMITFAKVVTSGYLPLGGVLVGGRVAAPFWEGSTRRPDVRPRLHVQRPRHGLRGGHGQPGHHRGRGPGRPGRRHGGRPSTPRSGAWRVPRWSARSGPWG